MDEKSLNFIEEIVEGDLATGKHSKILTRFPPEPNGFLHIGHAKSICLNFGLAIKYGGDTNLRFDDTNPSTEESVYVESIKNDVAWLGFKWAKECYASDYFETLYGYALQLIEKGLAYVDESSSDVIANEKGTPTTPGIENKFRSRPTTESKELFEKMKAGHFDDGSMVLRAKIDMGHPNMLLRDPIIYRIKRAHHHRTGNDWCIYPMYDFAHGQSDSIEQITHSICTLEFTDHRPLYNWFIEQLGIYPSQQYEFARLNMSYTVVSKRKLLQLVNEGLVSGWDDPRMPTLSGLRRRGFSPASIREFCEKIGIAKRENLIDFGLLEFCIRDQMNKVAPRRMVVFDPLKIVITNYSGDGELLESEDNPEDPNTTHRKVFFGKEIYIEQEDFMEIPPRKFFRLSPGQMVRLKSAYIIRCDSVSKDENSNITELHCTYLPESKSGQDTSGISVKGTLHWVSVQHALPITIRLYDRLFVTEDMDSIEGDFKAHLNPNSLQTVTAYGEETLSTAQPGDSFQFIRKGYFCTDPDSNATNLVFNRTVGLKDNWGKKQQDNK